VLDAWPREHRAWIGELPDRLGPRRLRLLVSALSRVLLEAGLREAGEGPRTDMVRRAVTQACDASDRFADTGKSKAALKEALREIQGVQQGWPFMAAQTLAICLVDRDPKITLDQCARVFQLWRKQPVDALVPVVRALVGDMTAPDGAPAFRPEWRSPEVLEIGTAIYGGHASARMPELAAALERAGCREAALLEHCRNGTDHARGCWVLDAVLAERIAKPARPPATATQRKRHEILGRSLHETLEVTLAVLARQEAKRAERMAPGSPQQQFDRVFDLDLAITYATLEHLGYGPMPDLHARLNLGVDRALEYFFGDWWRADPHDSLALDKSRPDRELQWSGVLAHGLLLAGLTGRWEDASRLCSWVDASIRWEPRFEMNDYEYQWLYVAIASDLRGEPLEGMAEIVQALRECRPRHPRLLCAAWEAAVARDQAAFGIALKESVAQFLARVADNAPNPNYWVALTESFIWLLAERNGLTFPKLPEKLEAAVLRRQTVLGVP
jgi:hypothetical protein